MHTDRKYFKFSQISLRKIRKNMAFDQQFVLKWHFHETTLIRNLPYLLENDILSDVTISVGAHNIKAHKIILAMCSVYFLQLFQDLKHTQHPVVVLHNVSLEEVKAMLSFMYKGQCVVSKDQLPNLLSVAKLLKIQGLCDMKVPEIEVTTNETIPNLVVDAADTTEKIPENENDKFECDKTNDTTVPAIENTVNQEKNTKKFVVIDERENLDKTVKFNDTILDSTDGSVSRYALENSSSISLKRHLENDHYDNSRDDDVAINLTIDSKKARGVGNLVWEKPVQLTPDNISPCSVEDVNLTYPPQTSILIRRPNSSGSKETSETCKCFLCGKYLSNQYNLRVHMETHEEAYHACQSCPHVSRSRDALRKHVSYRHPEEYVTRKRRKTDST